LLTFFRECVLRLIPGKALRESGGLVELTGFQGIQVFVGFQLALADLQHFHSHIGAMVCGALTGGQQILQYETVLHSAKAIPQTAHDGT